MAITHRELNQAYMVLSNAFSTMKSCPVGDAWEDDAISAVLTRNGEMHRLLKGKIRKTVREDFLQMCRNLLMTAASAAVKRRATQRAHCDRTTAAANALIGAPAFDRPANA
jgi:hypothetical protein